MSTPDRPELEPLPPLAETDGAAGDAIRAYRATREEPPSATREAEAWGRLEAKLDAPRAPTGAIAALAACAVVSAAAVAVVIDPSLVTRGGPPSSAPVASVAPSAPSVPTSNVPLVAMPTAAPAPPPPPLATRAAPLATGVSHLSPAIDLEASPDADGTVESDDDGRAVVRLARGGVELRSREPDAAKRARVVAGPYTFDDVGTVFAVRREGAFVTLAVREGGVVVARDGASLVTVRAGGSWRGALGAPSANREAPLAVDAGARASAAACRALVGAEPDRAIACYADAARGADLGAQTALFDLANLRRDLGDAAGALDDYRAHERRFGGGPLDTEVRLSEVELLASMGRAPEALDRSASLLADHPRLERAAELHLLRGHLYREAEGDLARAAIEYDAASREQGPASDEALFFRGACAEGSGDADAARAAYEAYLARGHLAREADAKKRLAALAGLKK